METVGTRVKALRKAKRLTQRDLADKCFVSQPAIANIERGRTSELKGHTLNSLATVLQTTETNLLYGDKQPSKNLTEFDAVIEQLSDADKQFLLRVAKGLLIQDFAKSFSR